MGGEFEANTDAGANSVGKMQSHALWDIFAAYMVSQKFTVGLCYLYTGDETLHESLRSGGNLSGLGDAYSLSLHYAF